MARWLLGLKKDELSAQKTFRMLNAFIVHKGDLLQVNTIYKTYTSKMSNLHIYVCKKEKFMCVKKKETHTHTQSFFECVSFFFFFCD